MAEFSAQDINSIRETKPQGAGNDENHECTHGKFNMEDKQLMFGTQTKAEIEMKPTHLQNLRLRKPTTEVVKMNGLKMGISGKNTYYIVKTKSWYRTTLKKSVHFHFWPFMQGK